MSKHHDIHWSQVVLTIVLSLLLLFSTTSFISSVWPSDVPVERMAAGSLLSPFIWLIYVVIGLLAKNIWKMLIWLTSLLILTTSLSLFL
ncbi:MAG: hypothetical protein COA95_07605 [Methylophaga sp.]|nr:MAG: hypothetical protein COA95_07605 [Methylophaga sp.]